VWWAAEVDRRREKRQKRRIVWVKGYSIKVVVFDTNLKGICDFLLVVINSNFGRMTHGFEATATSCSKSSLRDLPLSHWTPSLRQECSLANISTNFILPKLESIGYPPVKTASSYVYSFWHNTDVRWTDGQTEMLGAVNTASSLQTIDWQLTELLSLVDWCVWVQTPRISTAKTAKCQWETSMHVWSVKYVHSRHSRHCIGSSTTTERLSTRAMLSTDTGRLYSCVHVTSLRKLVYASKYSYDYTIVRTKSQLSWLSLPHLPILHR